MTRDRRLAVFLGLILIMMSALSAFIVVQVDPVGSDTLSPGDLAPRTVKAPRGFHYQDTLERQRLQQVAKESVRPVYIDRRDLQEEKRRDVAKAFRDAREDLQAALGEDSSDLPLEQQIIVLPAEQRKEILTNFKATLGTAIPHSDALLLLRSGFPVGASDLADHLAQQATLNYIFPSSSVPWDDLLPITVIRVTDTGREERQVADPQELFTPEQARQGVIVSLEADGLREKRWGASVAALVQALIRPNVRFSETETQRRMQQASDSVDEVERYVQKGTLLFLGGQVLTEQHVVFYQALQTQGSPNLLMHVFSVGVLFLLLFSVLFYFGSQHGSRFQTGFREVVAAAALLVFFQVISRFLVGVSDGLSHLVGYECPPSAVWLFIPVAGGAIVLRLLMGTVWATIFTLATAFSCAMLMELQGLYFLFFTLTGITGASAVHHTRERGALLRAGLIVGLVGAAAALFVELVKLYFVEVASSGDAMTSAVWSVLFAFAGGLLSSFVALALIPVFELLGFVTDYRMMELASLNHPLMKQLMLRAPGSYHHSVVVGSLAEAACDSIGANSLQAKISAHFHDIGKALKPQYFIENNRDGKSRHQGLDPNTSAQIIIGHVVDGHKLAVENRLPKAIIDNILMHHGTGLLQYFYKQAKEQASDSSLVRESDFRYPGPKPDSKESGIIMLADKVEAATRTIKEPTEEKFRAMISRIINSVIADGQFDRCPLTFRELHVIGESFVSILMGIHHQRIEYPQTAELSRSSKVKPKQGQPPRVITLELDGREDEVNDKNSAEGSAGGDYESVDYLPGR